MFWFFFNNNNEQVKWCPNQTRDEHSNFEDLMIMKGKALEWTDGSHDNCKLTCNVFKQKAVLMHQICSLHLENVEPFKNFLNFKSKLL